MQKIVIFCEISSKTTKFCLKSKRKGHSVLLSLFAIKCSNDLLFRCLELDNQRAVIRCGTNKVVADGVGLLD